MAGNEPFVTPVLFAKEQPPELDDEQKEFKRILYERMTPRRRKFIDRIGYDNWDPFQAPKEPLDIRRDATKRTLQELLREFMAQTNGAQKDDAWRAGASECALGIIQRDEKYQGIFDFCLWYANLLRQEGQSK